MRAARRGRGAIGLTYSRHARLWMRGVAMMVVS